MDKAGDSARVRYRRKPQQDRSVQRVEAILQAAEKLIANGGLADLKMTEIARVAGVPIGSLYQYFPQRAAIVKTLFDRLVGGVHAKMGEVFDDVTSTEDAVERICIIIDWYYDYFQENPTLMRILIAIEGDAELMMLNIADSRLVGGMFLETVRHLLPPDGTADMETRTFMFAHLIGSLVRLAHLSEPDLGRRLLEEWKTVIRANVFDPVPR